jgi:hypothetical protein
MGCNLSDYPIKAAVGIHLFRSLALSKVVHQNHIGYNQNCSVGNWSICHPTEALSTTGCLSTAAEAAGHTSFGTDLAVHTPKFQQLVIGGTGSTEPFDRCKLCRCTAATVSPSWHHLYQTETVDQTAR